MGVVPVVALFVFWAFTSAEFHNVYKNVDLISFHKISSKKIYFLLLFLKKKLDFFIIFVAIKVCAIVWACCFCS